MRAVPTFIFLKGGQVKEKKGFNNSSSIFFKTLATLKGINKDGLKNKLEELSKDSGIGIFFKFNFEEKRILLFILIN